MFEVFYIVAFDDGWYQLIVRDTHYCVSCGPDLNRILKVVEDYVKKYRTRDRLLRALSRLEGGGKVSIFTRSSREEYFRNHGEDFDYILNKVIRTALAEAKEYDRKNSPLVRTRTLLKKAGVAATKYSAPPKETPKSTLRVPSSRTKTVHKASVFKPRLIKA